MERSTNPPGQAQPAVIHDYLPAKHDNVFFVREIKGDDHIVIATCFSQADAQRIVSALNTKPAVFHITAALKCAEQITARMSAFAHMENATQREIVSAVHELSRDIAGDLRQAINNHDELLNAALDALRDCLRALTDETGNVAQREYRASVKAHAVIHECEVQS